MEGPLFSSTLTNRIYTEKAICIATLIGGPFVVGYLLAHNFKQLGEKHKVFKAWFWSTFGLVALLTLSAFMPDIIPNFLYTLFFFFVSAFFVHKYQSAQIKAHISAGGLTYKTYRGVVVGLISAAIMIAFLLTCYALADIQQVFE